MVTVSKEDGAIIFTISVGLLAAGLLVRQYRKTPYDSLFEEYGKLRNIDPDLLRAIAMKESTMHADIVGVEPGGHKSYGLMQIYDATAKLLKVEVSKLLDPRTNIEAGSRLMDENRKSLGSKFSLDTWIASFNANVGTILSKGIINQSYVASVKQNYYLYKIGREVT